MTFLIKTLLIIDDFKYKNEKSLTDKFNEDNDFRTNIRAVKIRGVYDTKKRSRF